jgi:hypothetical protein
MFEFNSLGTKNKIKKKIMMKICGFSLYGQTLKFTNFMGIKNIFNP